MNGRELNELTLLTTSLKSKDQLKCLESNRKTKVSCLNEFIRTALARSATAQKKERSLVNKWGYCPFKAFNNLPIAATAMHFPDSKYQPIFSPSLYRKR